MQPQTEALITASLKLALENMVKLVENQIIYSISNTKAVSGHIFLIQSLEKANLDELKEISIPALIKSSEKILKNLFSSISLYDPEGNLILSSGLNASHPDLIVELNTHSDIRSDLLWDGKFILRNSIPILNDESKFIGHITIEEPVPALTSIFIETALIGTTSDFLLCAPVKENKFEIDCFLRDFSGNQFKRMQRTIDNKSLPIHFALEGQNGIKFTQDYRQIKVVAAHSPVAYGLGAVLKIDEKELYSHLVDQIPIISLYLGLFVLFGIAILHWLTLPLIQKSIKSRDASIKTHQKLIQAKNDAEKIFSELIAYINAIGKLALVSINDRKGKIIKTNDNYVKSVVKEELIGQNHRLLNLYIHPKPLFVEMWTTIVKGEIWHQEICNRNKSGELYW